MRLLTAAVAALLIAAPAWAGLPVVYDDFNDGQINAAKWAWTTDNLVEAGWVLQGTQKIRSLF